MTIHVLSKKDGVALVADEDTVEAATFVLSVNYSSEGAPARVLKWREGPQAQWMSRNMNLLPDIHRAIEAAS